jgi:glycosyltransferase involved in cell wall biosynthesis
MQKLNILVLTPGFLPTIGGAEIGVHEIYARLGQRHNVTILTEGHKGRGSEMQALRGFDQSNYNVRHYPDVLNGGRVPGRMLLRGSVPPFSLGALWAADRLARKLRPDVVNVHYAAYVGLAAVWIRRAHRTPTVLSLVGRDSVPGPSVPGLWPWYAHQVARQVSHTVFISEFCQRHHLERHEQLRSTVVPYGTDTTKICPQPADPTLRKQLCIPDRAKVLLSLQRLSALKHVEVAILSVRRLVEQGRTDVILLIGGSGPEERRLRQRVVSLGLRDSVRFLGFLPEPELPRYFALADIFCFPSIFETFGIVLAQAMAAGLPVVAVDSSAVPEVVQCGITGLLVPPLDVDAMAVNIARLLDDPLLRRQMGQAARERAVQLYDWERVARLYEKVICEAVREGAVR